MKRRWKITLWVAGGFIVLSVIGSLLPPDQDAMSGSAAPQEAAASESRPQTDAHPASATSAPAKNASSNSSDSSRPTILIGEHYVTNNSALMGCKTLDEFDKLLDFLNQGDEGAFKEALAQSTMSGDCDLFGTGEEVYVSDIKIFRRMALVHRQGHATEYWITDESLDSIKQGK